MDTRLATTEIRLTQWAQIIQDRSRSGMTVDDYCELHELSRNAYYYWLRRVKEAALTEAGFVELSVPSSSANGISAGATNTGFIPQLTVSVGQAVIGVSSETPMDLLSRTLEVIRNAQ